MTKEQREKLCEIMGTIEGLGWGIDKPEVADGFIGVVEDLAKLLKEDDEDATR